VNYFGDRVEVVVTACGAAWPMHHFVSAVHADDPVLTRKRHGVYAACARCRTGNKTGWTAWNQLLVDQRS